MTQSCLSKLRKSSHLDTWTGTPLGPGCNKLFLAKETCGDPGLETLQFWPSAAAPPEGSGTGTDPQLSSGS